MREDEFYELPVVVDLVTAAEVLGIGCATAYEMVRTGRWPTPVVRPSSRIRVPTAALRSLLGLAHDPHAPPAALGRPYYLQ